MLVLFPFLHTHTHTHTQTHTAVRENGRGSHEGESCGFPRGNSPRSEGRLGWRGRRAPPRRIERPRQLRAERGFVKHAENRLSRKTGAQTVQYFHDPFFLFAEALPSCSLHGRTRRFYCVRSLARSWEQATRPAEAREGVSRLSATRFTSPSQRNVANCKLQIRNRGWLGYNFPDILFVRRIM